jgi:hypothetical protein
MAGESEVLAEARRMFEEAGVADRYEAAVQRWADDGLPRNSGEGGVGRAQLLHVVATMRELATDVASTSSLRTQFRDRDVVFVDRSQLDVARGRQPDDDGLLNWATELRRAANVIENFASAQDDDDSR